MTRRIRPCLLWAGILLPLAGCAPAPPPVLGTLERDRITLPAPVFERISELPLTEGQAVRAGDTIVVLEATRTTARLAAARAELDRSQSVLAELEAGARPEAIAEARARLGGVQALARHAGQELERVQSIVRRGLQPQSALDAARAARDASAAEVGAAREALALLEHGSRVEQLDQARAAVAAAAAQVEALQIDAERTRLTAPRDGVIDQLPFDVGDQQPVGTPLAVLLVGERPHARVYVPQTLRPRVAVGSLAQVQLAGAAAAVPGRVRSIQSEPVFTPYYALSGADVSHLSWLAEIELDAAASDWPVGMPVAVEFAAQTP